MKSNYETDVVEWANEQSRLIRAGRFELLDLEHIAEEIEEVGKSEKREMTSRMAVLLAHLLKWQYQPERRCRSWDLTIKAQRKELEYSLGDTPSLRASLTDNRWLDMVWAKAVSLASQETDLDCFPEVCPWTMGSEILNEGWLPD